MHIRVLLPPLALLAIACPGGGSGPDESLVGLSHFESCKELKSYVAEATLEQLVQSRYGYRLDVSIEGDTSAGEVDGSAGPESRSETNVQEQGVDEPDLVKSDGQHIFIAQSNALTIVKSWPAIDAVEVAKVEIEGNPTSLFLHEDRAIVFSQSWDESWPSDEATGYRYGSGTRITVVDVSQPESPEVMREVTIEGEMIGARMIGDQMYVTTRRYHGIPAALWDAAYTMTSDLDPVRKWWAEPTEEEILAIQDIARERLRGTVHAGYAALDTGAFLLSIREDGQTTSAGGCTSILHADEITTPELLSVVHVDMGADRAGGELQTTSVMASGSTMYASEDHIYIAQGSFSWWWGWGSVDRSTRIHRFELSDEGTAYTATGVVPGWLHNQFSMSEYEGLLRVATTDLDWWWGTSTDGREDGNNVFILDPAQGQMQIIGSIEGLAPGERIYAARFQGDKGYLVTFRQVDPLFTLDLADPTRPRAVGELKIPGYSAYLHPRGNARLIGVGMDGTDDGQITGVSVSLFDVSDFARPTEVDRVTVETEWGSSEALWDHHAITVHNNLLTVPYWGYDEDEEDGWGYINGLLVVDVTKNRLEERTRIDHKDLIKEALCGDDWDCEDVYYWGGEIRRSIIMDDYLFSVSDYGIKVSDLASGADEVASVVFK